MYSFKSLSAPSYAEIAPVTVGLSTKDFNEAMDPISNKPLANSGAKEVSFLQKFRHYQSPLYQGLQKNYLYYLRLLERLPN